MITLHLPFDREIYSPPVAKTLTCDLSSTEHKTHGGIPFVEQELAAIVCPSGDPVSQGSRWSPPGLASRYLVNGEINAGYPRLRRTRIAYFFCSRQDFRDDFTYV